MWSGTKNNWSLSCDTVPAPKYHNDFLYFKSEFAFTLLLTVIRVKDQKSKDGGVYLYIWKKSTHCHG